MRRNELLALGALVLLGVVFVTLTARLFALRFQAGDIYPTYSSLRTDPIGTRAFFDSLADNPSLMPVRNFEQLEKLTDEKGTTLLYLGADLHSGAGVGERGSHGVLDAFVRAGGRLVVAFEPLVATPRRSTPSNPDDTKKESYRKFREEQRNPPSSDRIPSFVGQWGADLFTVPLERKEDGDYKPAEGTLVAAEEKQLPPTIIAHTSLYLFPADKAWTPLYARGENPLIMERTHGKGSIVLCADGYYFSNEGLRHSRQPELLLRLIGPNRRVIFDETHLGVSENPGIMALAMRYHLYPVLIVLIALGILFIWANATSLVPRMAEDPGLGEVPGARDSFAGLVNLLRRNIAHRDLLRACLNEWKRSLPAGKEIAESKLRDVDRIIEAETAQRPTRRDAAAAYRKICTILDPRR